MSSETDDMPIRPDPGLSGEGVGRTTVVVRWDEKAGLRRDAVGSQVIDVLEAQEIKETGLLIKQLDRDPQTGRTLSNVSVRRFGDTAILTGILTTTSVSETSREATTVVFARSFGKWKIASAQWSPVKEAGLC
jgi:hypothetical protein